MSSTQLSNTHDILYVPQHVAIIMDGNRRWAHLQGKRFMFGYKYGVKAVRRSIHFAISHGIKILTLYAFSSENWKRPEREVTALIELFIHTLDSGIKRLHKYNIRLKFIGNISRFSYRLQERILRSENITANNNGLILNIAANYGGRWDIIQGVKILATQVKINAIQPSDITENLLNQLLCLYDLVPVDLVIRTGGEYRISNFLLWQIAYSELYFTDVLWPDFDELTFSSALNAFTKRNRRFGNS
ncbi:polyprenyl diphosphate synthase [Candidatus Profftia sp. (ex Adelges kitamiensis)]|uniref:polyprenyl diphosphate synthase n=1 Tax=Candidatus Profftia sp. (ex Adelges kitamiensis) TaxID=2864218 RepID=UPI001CE3455A|nr:polyprenyl diphosphate synthase [Candidatus Profftia sp. (ex Adelges kitamiensis)]